MRPLIFLTFLLFHILSFSQPVLTRKVNSTLLHYSNTHAEWNKPAKLSKWARKDTLKLPFFDDFVSTTVYPDSTRWYNNYVFVNNDFPVNPPSFGVATFDNLNAQGKPYFQLNSALEGPGDTLLSLPINLRDSGTTLYTLKDSIFFSFYFQRQGLGDPSDEAKDSLVLQYRDNAGNWRTQWKAKGGTVHPFNLVILPLRDLSFFYKGFQFRFISYSRRTGNLNQWHLDYVHLARNRKSSGVYYNDFAVQSRPTSLLKKYFQMPYDHFLADISNQRKDSIFFNASNLSNTVLNIEARHIETNQANVLVSSSFSANAANVPAGGNAKRRFPAFDLSGLTGSPVVVKREYELRESGITSKYAANDKLTVYQEFNSCYAYDDGTAEYGFGYNDDELHADYKGAIAYKFSLTKPDTLWAIGMFFNQSEKPSSAFKFDLKVWQKITAPGQGRSADQSLITLSDRNPEFTDSLNGFKVFYLDSVLVLPKGDFYIGWEQTGNNNLDVGWDMNNGYHDPVADNLFYLDNLGSWSKADNLKGALMMRPYVGVRKVLGPATTREVQRLAPKVYPNPFQDRIQVEVADAVVSLTLFDLSGKVQAVSAGPELDTGKVPPGIYSLKTLNNKGEIYYQKMLKLQE